MRVVVALGGNAIAAATDVADEPGPDESGLDVGVRAAAAAIADIARGHDVVVTHGNGPQVGALALRSRSGAGGSGESLDALGAESEGLIGYVIERELASIFPGSPVATLLTQVEVRADDPAFENPTKPIGPYVSAEVAEDLSSQMGWHFIETRSGFRRVVPSPEPQRIRELKAIEVCLEAGVLVICAGGGGVPVVESDHGLRGVEAVIDKDLTAALLAQALGADTLLLLTDVAAVYEDWPAPRERALRRASVETLEALDFEPGSMAPKVEAACRFVRSGGDARIGALADATRVLRGEAGTRVCSTGTPVAYW